MTTSIKLFTYLRYHVDCNVFLSICEAVMLKISSIVGGELLQLYVETCIFHISETENYFVTIVSCSMYVIFMMATLPLL